MNALTGRRRLALVPRRALRRTGFYMVLLLALIALLFVPLFMLATSLKEPIDVVAGAGLLPTSPTLDNYVEVWQSTTLPSMVLNSLIVGVASTGIALVLGLPAAYSIARYRRANVGRVIIVARAVPAISLLVPYFIVFSNVGLIDSFPALIIAHTMLTVPLLTWLMVGYFEDLPQELEDAAYVDGATTFQAFFRVMLPLARGGVAATSILSFIFSWNNLIFAAGLAGSSTRTVPLAAFEFLSFEAIEWGPVSAAASIVALPVVVLALAAQRQLVRGLGSGAVKG